MKKSCGILLYKHEAGEWKFLLVHPGGEYNIYSPWGIPKGMVEEGENELECAVRETEEELGMQIPVTSFLDVGTVYNSGSHKTVHAFAVYHDIDVTKVKSNTCEVYWQGRMIEVPEIDEARWMNYEMAKLWCSPVQFPLVQKLYDYCLDQTENN